MPLFIISVTTPISSHCSQLEPNFAPKPCWVDTGIVKPLTSHPALDHVTEVGYLSCGTPEQSHSTLLERERRVVTEFNSVWVHNVCCMSIAVNFSFMVGWTSVTFCLATIQPGLCALYAVRLSYLLECLPTTHAMRRVRHKICFGQVKHKSQGQTSCFM